MYNLKHVKYPNLALVSNLLKLFYNMIHTEIFLPCSGRWTGKSSMFYVAKGWYVVHVWATVRLVNVKSGARPENVNNLHNDSNVLLEPRFLSHE